ncbi:iron complex transport system permease protein [Tranquillimonas rosea]|uniref:Iron complex transport system permease protein n=1 Tax=Tranquillimonas rosea TaxID=641238 RepID=A0A1H9XAK1_9RHOB|nr:iron chelate uptake ABC transporter family permease subunit [Tranquillimonas rosea]SES43081.1 iron complex transport system permease protein [Tranquillimonas rosea]
MPGRPVRDGRLILLAAALGLACVLFLTVGAQGDWAFVLRFRGAKLGALLVVGTAIAVATVTFQTVSGNRILTPSVMGIDALFLLFQTLLVFLLGGAGFAAIGPHLRFLAEAGLLMGAATLLFGLLLGRGRADLHRMVLTGIIFGVLFRSLTGLMQRMIDPSDFAVVQSAAFARFSSVETDLLGLSAVLCAVICAALWRMRHALDVLALGREAAIGLGLAYRRTVIAALALVAALVSVSTALVGPVTFFGLLVAALAHGVLADHRHARLLPAAALMAGLVLVAGQLVLDHVFDLATTLSVVVEFAGGLAFLFLVLKGSAR